MSKKYLLNKYFLIFFFLATFVSPLCLTPQIIAALSVEILQMDGGSQINRFQMRYFFYCFWILLHFWDNTRALYKAPLNNTLYCATGIRYLSKGHRQSRLDFCLGFCCVLCVEFENVVHIAQQLHIFVKRFTAMFNV